MEHKLNAQNKGNVNIQTGKQHVGFRIADDEFLLEVGCVREIIMLPHISFIPHNHPSVEGVIALRGEIMPLLNLRRLLNFSRGQSTQNTRVVVISKDDLSLGLIVDEITEFVWIEDTHLEAVAAGLFSSEFQILQGVGKVGEKVRGVISVDAVLRIIQLKYEGSETSQIRQKHVS